VPYMMSFAFLIPVAAMAYQLSSDVARSSQLARELDTSRAELHENEQRMELAVSGAGLGLWRWDVARRELWVNERGRALFGLNGTKTIELDHVLGVLIPEDQIFLKQAIAQSTADHGDYGRECRIVLPDGSARWIATRGRVEFNGGTAPVAIRGVCFDITARRQAERDHARQRDELTHLSRVAMLGELSGSMAHELNQPLTAILSNAQAAQEFLSNGSGTIEEVRGILQDIVDEDRRAREVIRRLRTLFRKGEVQYEAIDLNELVREVLKLMNSEMINHGVTVHTELAPELPTVRGDRVQLQQVVINLLANGSDAMAENEMDDRTLCVRTGLDETDHVWLSVADTGCGIPHGQTERVFEPFHTTKSKGMGLGLTVSRTIITAHGGKLVAANNPDRGASFRIELSPMEAAVP